MRPGHPKYIRVCGGAGLVGSPAGIRLSSLAVLLRPLRPIPLFLAPLGNDAAPRNLPPPVQLKSAISDLLLSSLPIGSPLLSLLPALRQLLEEEPFSLLIPLSRGRLALVSRSQIDLAPLSALPPLHRLLHPLSPAYMPLLFLPGLPRDLVVRPVARLVGRLCDRGCRRPI